MKGWEDGPPLRKPCPPIPSLRIVFSEARRWTPENERSTIAMAVLVAICFVIVIFVVVAIQIAIAIVIVVRTTGRNHHCLSSRGGFHRGLTPSFSQMCSSRCFWYSPLTGWKRNWRYGSSAKKRQAMHAGRQTDTKKGQREERDGDSRDERREQPREEARQPSFEHLECSGSMILDT